MKKYFDACALGNRASVVAIVNSHSRAECITSHLAIGEALSNLIVKGESEEACKQFVMLIHTLHRERKLEIVQHDDVLVCCDTLLSDIKERLGRIDGTDAIHIAMAIKKKCNEIVTSDQDIIGNRGKLIMLAAENGLSDFGVHQI